MIAALRTAWQSRSPLERTVIAALAAVVAALLYAGLLQAAWQGRDRLLAALPGLRAQAGRLDALALEYDRLRATPAVTASPIDLRTLLQGKIGEAGLAPALIAIEAAGNGGVRVVFGAVPFADWLAWVAALQSLQVRAEQIRIEALATPGFVSASATLTRDRP